MKASVKRVEFIGQKCFSDEWSGFEDIKPINLIIGKNNTGKSHLLELVETSCKMDLGSKDWHMRYGILLNEEILKQAFKIPNARDFVSGDPWEAHGKELIGTTVFWDIKQSVTAAVENMELEVEIPETQYRREQDTIGRKRLLVKICNESLKLLERREFRRINSDRDILPEIASDSKHLEFNGIGATNIIRKFLNSADPMFPRSVIQIDLLNALNEIFAWDGQFNEIEVQHYDYSGAPYPDQWEICLLQKEKGLIPLSSSGSGLKTIILVLLNLLVLPKIGRKANNERLMVYAFEELENNLHPSLFRRLLEYIEDYAVKNNRYMFLTSHSNVALDFFGLSENAQIIHVTHDGKSARTRTISRHFDKLEIISDLGARPSDLLQANGIIWVEGPSDRIYLNKWISLLSNGKYNEGRDYQCAFYGGALLASVQATEPESEIEKFVNLIRINPNIIVICDGDRSKPGQQLKPRVEKIRQEVDSMQGGHVWITEGREIENYIYGSILENIGGVKGAPDPDQYMNIFEISEETGKSYLSEYYLKSVYDKVEFALLCTQFMNKENMEPRFDWLVEMKKIVDRIEEWNNA